MHYPVSTILTALLSLLSLPQVIAQLDTGRSKYQPRPYKIDVPAALINDIRFKAAHYRPVLDINAPPWFDGPPSANISEAAKYIASEYNWFQYQDYLNANFSHYITTTPAPNDKYPYEQDLHFIHQKSPRSDAIPMILIHGWPSTSLEWEKIVGELANPQDPLKPAFHVVAPDLPGFGFSPAPVAPGLGGPEHATILASLMEQLRYKSYAVYSTNLGFIVGMKMVERYGERILNHVTDSYVVMPNATDSERYGKNQTTAEESRYISSFNAFFTNHSAYASIHSSYPLSIAHSLNDSPVGFLAWMWQLDFTGRDLSVPYTLRELVSQALTLFIPGVYGNIRSYKELYPTLMEGFPTSHVPTSVLQWGYPKPSYPDLAYFGLVVR